MKPFKFHIRNSLYFIPGLIILTLCMVALSASVRTSQDTMVLKSYYEMRVLSEQHNTFGEASAESLIFDKVFERLDYTGSLVYWAILAIGLSGFVLLVFNADRLKTLEALNEEKQEGLKLLESRLAAMDASLDGIAIIDAEHKITYINHAMLKLYGAREEAQQEWIGQEWVSALEAGCAHKLKDQILPEMQQYGQWSGEFAFQSKTGSVLNTQLSLSPLMAGGYVVSVHDITDEVEANKEKEQVQGQLYQAQKMEAIGRLAGGIAHDFNNILAAMNGYAEFLVEDLEGQKEQQKFAQNILKAGQQARSLVDQMLAFSRRSNNELEAMDLHGPINESLSMLQASLPKTVDLQADIAMESAPITGNPTQITQVLMNLCVNAKDAMNEEKGVLRVGLHSFNPSEDAPLTWLIPDLPDPKELPNIFIEDAGADRTRLYLGMLARDKEYACLSVQDNGTGMSRLIMEKIFEPFFTTKPVEKGTGLGLSTVHGVVSLHQGAMKIDSKSGEGTRFELYWPLIDGAEMREEVEDIAEVSSSDSKILLVEDQEDVRMMTETMLVRLGYEVITVANGLEALDKLREDPEGYHVVVTDHNMPKMTGLELVYQANMDFPDLPFVLLSGYSEEKLQDLMSEHEAIKFILRKPTSKAKLAQAISDVLKESSRN